ncbi:MAG TPA: iron-containing alcohol dehydrogenase, partial [Terriglobia bacterium]|nr:iron-containing alcohol dehydrogenase [Terriglobia bacterium]
MTESFDLELRTRVIFGAGTFKRLGELARALGFTRTLVVSDKGLLPTGVAEQARTLLGEAGIESWGFHDFEPNPDMQMVETGRI